MSRLVYVQAHDVLVQEHLMSYKKRFRMIAGKLFAAGAPKNATVDRNGRRPAWHRASAAETAAYEKADLAFRKAVIAQKIKAEKKYAEYQLWQAAGYEKISADYLIKADKSRARANKALETVGKLKVAAALLSNDKA